MLTRPQSLRAATNAIVKPHLSLTQRCLHNRPITAQTPPPTPFVPDVPTFLSLIGRNSTQYASKIPSWDALFKLSSEDLKNAGVEVARDRRYILRWRDKFRKGIYGHGGNLKHVVDGVAKVKMCDVPVSEASAGGESTPAISSAARPAARPTPATMTRSAGYRRVLLNLPDELIESGAPEELAKMMETGELERIKGLRINGSNQIVGSKVEAVKGSEGKIVIVRASEGLWEQKRGHKVDGGERRKAEVRAKRRAAERKAARS